MNTPILKWSTLILLLALSFGSSAFATVNDPVVTAIGGASTSPQTVSVTISQSGGASIYFTTDGSNPTTASESIASGGTVLIAKNSTLNVQAFQNGTTSNLVSVNYGINATVSAGFQHSLFLKNDGTVWASGDNSYGELGIGNTTPSSTPVQVLAAFGQSGYLQNIVAVAADGNESYAVDNQGNVWAWGENDSGQLGGNFGIPRVQRPAEVPGITGAVAVATSQAHTVVLTNTGAVWGWGANSFGQVGNGALTAWEPTPVQVMAAAGQPLSGIVAVAAGASHTLAIDDNGNVWAWGANGSGQLGNGDTSGTTQNFPVQVQNVAGAVTIAAGTSNGYALESNGKVFAWGDNSIGELGNGSTSSTFSATPTQVSGLGPMVSLANQFAVDSSNNIWAWGDNTSGRLGLGAQGNDATLPLELNLYSGTIPSLADTAGNNQTVNWNSFTALTVTVTNGATPLQNTLVDFTITQGGGLLALSPGATQESGIVQVLTNASGQATIYFQEAPSGSGSTQITATSDNGQTLFSVINSGIGVPALPAWGYGVLGVLMFFAMGRFLRKKHGRLVS